MRAKLSTVGVRDGRRRDTLVEGRGGEGGWDDGVEGEGLHRCVKETRLGERKCVKKAGGPELDWGTRMQGRVLICNGRRAEKGSDLAKHSNGIRSEFEETGSGLSDLEKDICSWLGRESFRCHRDSALLTEFLVNVSPPLP